MSPPGQSKTRPGDLLLTRRSGPLSRLISWGQGLRGPQYKWATHAGIVVEDDRVVEALGRGVVVSPLEKYWGVPHRIVPLPTTDGRARERVVDFALHAVGRKYGYLEILTLGVYLATGTKLRLVFDNQLICSALAAEAWSRVVIFPFEPLFAMPEDLARFCNVTEDLKG